MKNYIFFITLIVCIINGSFAKSPKWMNGKWLGTGYQTDGSTWKVEFTKDGSNLYIAYPSLGCNGNWKIVKASKSRIDLEETITEGTDKCDQGCKIIVFKVDETQISVVYSLPSYQKNAIGYAVLVKQ